MAPATRISRGGVGLKHTVWFRGSCDVIRAQVLLSLRSAFHSISFILKTPRWTLAVPGLSHPHPMLKSRRIRTLSSYTVCMKVISLTGPHWSQAGLWNFLYGQEISLALGPCLPLVWGLGLRGAASQGKDNPLEGKSGCCHQKKEKRCRMTRRLQTSTGYKCHTLNATKMYFFLSYTHWVST